MKKRIFSKFLPGTLDISAGLSYKCLESSKITENQKGTYMKYRTPTYVCAQEDSIHGAE